MSALTEIFAWFGAGCALILSLTAIAFLSDSLMDYWLRSAKLMGHFFAFVGERQKRKPTPPRSRVRP